jgi:predicted nucleic acid-binding protein
MILIDTDVLVEFLRGSLAAKRWLETLPQETFAIPGVVAMELLAGCRNQIELQQVRTFLSKQNLAWPDSSKFAQGYEILSICRLATGISIPDCLIAATAIARNARLYTFNLKHFQGISGLDVQQPYQRLGSGVLA